MSEITNYTYCQDTLKLKETIENSFLDLGERLLKIRDGRLYYPEHENFSTFIWEMKMSDTAASKLINIYQKFVLEYGFDRETLLRAGGWSNIAEILPLCDTKMDADYWLEQSELLPRHELRNVMKEKKTGIEQSKCLHEDFYEIRVCRSCGDRRKILPE